MQINLNDKPLLDAMLARLTKEYSETAAANFALDIIADSLAADNEKLRQHIAALVEKTTNDRELIDTLRKEIENLAPRKKK